MFERLELVIWGSLWLWSPHRHSHDFIWGRGHFFLKKLMTFLVVALNAHAKTAKLTTTTLKLSSTQQKFIKNGLFALPGGTLTTYPCKLRQKILFSPWGCTCTHCTPWLRSWSYGAPPAWPGRKTRPTTHFTHSGHFGRLYTPRSFLCHKSGRISGISQMRGMSLHVQCSSNKMCIRRFHQGWRQ